ncbi:MAG TPA: YjbH domain-containing protein, partial [Aliiroseovarius sp.]|nr:YjbH domain-containing protein [Aliiroseovarius sp.]
MGKFRIAALALLISGLPVAQTIPQALAQAIPQGVDAPSFTPLPPPSLSFYGSPGLIDMPSAEMLPDAQYTTSLSHFGGQTRFNLTFQAFPWLSATFRYNGINDLNLFGFSTYYDRGFDVRFRLLQERRLRPGLTLGLQDFAGTGVYAAEYLVATKRFRLPALGASRGAGWLKVSAGLGWGRLGTYGSIGSTGGKRGKFVGGSTGGNLAVDQWFRGPFAPFGGVEWQVNDRLGLKLEYSSDAYRLETRRSRVFKRKSPLNFGVEWQARPRTRVGLYYLYGSELGATVQFQLNPRLPPTKLHIDAPTPIVPRPPRAQRPELWDDAWAASASSRANATQALRPLLAAALKKDGLRLESLEVSGGAVELRFSNQRYASMAGAVGRAARALAATMPSSVE